ncbi:tyrosinase family oxidase copper chaperone [Streptomyces sp. NPDC091292]|uniref:tyrosinase family oxidase copper chaperone n=1 Tax=Streptomyces sp. NPDC091292 TaxID=3365991 RepID=UPI0037F43E4A
MGGVGGRLRSSPRPFFGGCGLFVRVRRRRGLLRSSPRPFEGASVGVVLKRRVLVRSLFVVVVTGGVGGALVPVVVVRRDRVPRDVVFDEVYRGRRIRGVPVDVVGVGHGHGEGSGGVRVTVDGRSLELMRRADGGYLSMVDHYASYATPLEAARAAVDELGTARLARERVAPPTV